MPVYRLGKNPELFPPPEQADDTGLLAIGGDLSPERLLAGYRRGIFPWYGEGLPILWHCPDPRFVLEVPKLHVPKSLQKTLKRETYEVRYDTAFARVIAACAQTPRPGQDGTWITDDMQQAYVRLHQLGIAHSVEAWREGALCGGLYGVALGGIFFGESMFAHSQDASKVAFVKLVERLAGWGFSLVDCQTQTAHLQRFGAEMWPRARFLESLQRIVNLPGHAGPWL